jgi:hypothetical protein
MSLSRHVSKAIKIFVDVIVGGVAEFTGGKGSIWVGSRTAMRGVIAALLLVVAVLAWGLTSEVKKNSQLRGQVEQLTKKLTDKSRLEDLQLQEKCAEQAKKVFNEYKSAPLPNIYLKNPQPRELDTEYQSHYNAKLGKCFMEIKSTILDQQGGDASFNRFLADAYERRVYADYMWNSRKDKKYWEVPPIICKLIASSASEQICKSEDEYKAFVATYIE